MRPTDPGPRQPAVGRRRFLALSVTAAAAPLATCADDDAPTGATELGSLAEVRAALRDGGGRYRPEGFRGFVVAVDDDVAAEALATAFPVASDGLAQGLLALGRTCPHQGCDVNLCGGTWFRCPCHASEFNEYGQVRDGPANRGLDVVPIVVDGDAVRVDPAQAVSGVAELPIGSDEADDC